MSYSEHPKQKPLSPSLGFYSVWRERALYINEIIEEYSEILTKLTNRDTAAIVLNAILNSPFVEFITPYYRFSMIHADPDDNKFVDCAIAGNARYIELTKGQTLREQTLREQNFICLIV